MTPFPMPQAMSVLDPLLADLDDICRAAFDRYRGYPQELLIDHSPRAQAACVYDHMVAEAAKRLTAHPGVVPVEVQNLKLWVVADAVVLRFKKMDEEGRTRTYPTRQALDYDRQRLLPGLPAPPVNLTVGYVLDRTQTILERVQIARPAGPKAIEWCAAIIPEDQMVAGQPRWMDTSRQARAV